MISAGAHFMLKVSELESWYKSFLEKTFPKTPIPSSQINNILLIF